jgi:nicotinate-nucleotide pyrophosphorylase (carboxylating)
MLERAALAQCVERALEEDLGSGDLTSQAVLDASTRAVGRMVAREPLVVAGLEVAQEVFRRVDAGVAFEDARPDGDAVRAGDTLLIVRGPARALLAGERTALNFVQRLSGIATATRDLVRRVEGTGCEIADTRKTAPGLRLLDKYAVAVGGGTNHRRGLDDAYLIKDNHWRLAGGIRAALQRARRAAGPRPPGRLGLEIEVGTVEEAREAIAAGADALLLDNMDDETLRRAVAEARGRVFLEVSGGIGPERLGAIAALGVQRISIGALTHSVRAVDVALEVEAA